MNLVMESLNMVGFFFQAGVIDKLDATTRVCVGQSPESMTTNHNATPSHVVMTDDEDLTLNSCKNPGAFQT